MKITGEVHDESLCLQESRGGGGGGMMQVRYIISYLIICQLATIGFVFR